MKVEEVLSCSFQNWYPDFRKITIRSIILPLPHEFVSYILKDGIVLPSSHEPLQPALNSDIDDSDDEINWDNCNEDEAEAPHFPDFDEKISDAIETLGGKVFPKLNWSSPQDASWIAFNNSCCCTSVSDIYLLLKSSDFIIYDLTKMLSDCEDYTSADGLNIPSNKAFYLILRKWIDIDTSGEFRCFVKDDTLIGISQREHSLYFDHIDVYKNDIVQDISVFFQQQIHYKFSCSSYVFDVFRKKKDCIYLIDFNPFGKATEGLLFDWSELMDGSVTTDLNGLPQFRYVSNNHGVQPRILSYHAIPQDIIDISSGEDSFKFVDLLKLKIEEQNKDVSDDENT